MQVLAHVTGQSHQHAGFLDGYHAELTVIILVSILLVLVKWLQVKKR